MASTGWLSEPWHTAAMRLGRADQLAESFGEIALAWSRGTNDEGPLIHQQVERTPGLLDFEVTSIRPVPPIASMYFSEAISHLRAVVDNVLFGLIEADHGAPLTESQARSVAMPIYDASGKFNAKIARLVKSGLTSFDPSTALGQRVASLQPFNDTASSLPAVSPAFALLTGQQLELGAEHPLLLLQAYSNEDKHRTIRVAAAGALYQDEQEWPPPEVSMNPIAVGDVLGQAVKGTPKLVSISAALLVQRPTSGRWIPPGPELDGLTAYVSEILLPTLVRGMALPGAFPGHIDLGDNGQTLAERLADGDPDRALARSAERTRAAFFEAMQADLRFPTIVSHADQEIDEE